MNATTENTPDNKNAPHFPARRSGIPMSRRAVRTGSDIGAGPAPRLSTQDGRGGRFGRGQPESPVPAR